ncbi:MAG: response regulator [Flavobacterium sp. 38-13]|uniref:response regulator transcription factor n=1 Tax=Flavobacterium sp. 38-13 TaxID=1896168 RepID=UPI00095DB612|nr:response regulator transcription factor [Flavobacterium sp. 38-13]OJX49655.1 MAG: response regulator [Flavobacterium sp. 38-13]
MFKKIIVAEDIDSISQGLKVLLEKLEGVEVVYTKYCDETYLKIKKAENDNEPFELLITDLSSKSSHMDVNLTSGEQLIGQLKKENFDIAIIVYSIDERGYSIRHLLDDIGVDGYVSKGRESTRDLLKAIKAAYAGEQYISPHLIHLKKPSSVTDIDQFDLEIIQLLAKGLNQIEIVEDFKRKGKKASSISSIEKRIIKMKASLKAKNTTHLISLAKDMGLL